MIMVLNLRMLVLMTSVIALVSITSTPLLMFLHRMRVVERKNETLVEMARTMLDEHRTPRHFWAEVINTACYVANRIFLRSFMKKTSYELRFGRQPKVSHLRAFGCRCFVLKEGNLDKFESRSSDGIFLGYALHQEAIVFLFLRLT